MAQKNSGDLFNFVIEPQFDTNNIKDDSKVLENELKKIAERISTEIADKMGDAFNFPKNFDMSDITQVLQLVSKLGGELSRTGTNISAAFKDADGNIVKVTGSIEDAIGKLETLRKNELSQAIKSGSKDAADAAKQQLEALSEYQKTGITYTGSEQIKEQNELEKQIIKSIQEQYSLEKKIQEAKASNNTVNEMYYEDLQNIAKQEEARYQTDYKGSQTRINAVRNELEAGQQLYNTKLQIQSVEEKTAQVEQSNLKESLDLLTQYQSVKSKLDTEEAKNGTGSEYYQALDSQLNDIIAKMNQYGLLISQNTGNVIFDNTASSAVKASENIDKVEKKVEGVNTALTTNAAKLQDVANAEAKAKQEQIDYDKQQKNVKEFESALSKLVSTKQRLSQLESQGKTDTEEYKVLTKQYGEAKSKLESFGATVSDTNVTITRQSSIVNGDAETLEKLSNKCKDSADKMELYEAKAKDSSDSQNTFSKSIQDSVENFIKYQVAMEAINKITSEFTSAIYDMNEAMTQVRMVTMGSYEDTVALADSYTQLAKQLGTTTTTVAEGADAWFLS